MGRKHKHSKDKLHKTVSELSSHHVGTNRDLELSVLHRRLKFDSCCLSLNTVSAKPMGLCDQDGYCYVFECELIVKFLGKFHIHPITGHKVTSRDLIELRFHKNNENQYHCPVIYKLFNQHSKIVANRKSGNVYSYEAYQQLNLKPNYFNDLLTDEPFERQDIVTIQDPAKADEKWDVAEFHYVKNKLKLEEDTDDSNIRDIERSNILKSSLEEYKSKSDTIAETFNRLVGQVDDADATRSQTNLDKINSAVYSDGALSSSVTSTVAPVEINQKAALLNEAQILYPRIKKKGYVQLMTNFGPINLELYCDRVPKTCHNYLQLITRGYYNDTCFHRLIKNFILQGGDPTGTGSGGQSAWGEPFEDEWHGDLKHEGRGVLAMANSGPNTNKSQFYLTLRGVWDHLDGKHTVFGRVVGGYDTLDRIESEVETDKNDRPKKEIRIIKAIKYVDPYEEVLETLKKQRHEAKLGESDANSDDLDTRRKKKFRSGVGAYINLDRLQSCSEKMVRQKAALSCGRQQDRTAADEKNCPIADSSSPVESETRSLSGRLLALSKRSNGSRYSGYGDFSNW